ncbi:hypothetical protein QFZ23_003897 [Arthrobacter globiformis]|nr:hypothetical protein [Arthrobacter globiformis]MDQ1059996.1 hypothetical protein [Arthrobacter globiformis]
MSDKPGNATPNTPAFKTLDERRLNLIYKEQRPNGTSNFFLLENPEREDA